LDAGRRLLVYAAAVFSGKALQISGNSDVPGNCAISTSNKRDKLAAER
jgi:hypothetical protein